jgi:hypothetical protein
MPSPRSLGFLCLKKLFNAEPPLLPMHPHPLSRRNLLAALPLDEQMAFTGIRRKAKWYDPRAVY